MTERVIFTPDADDDVADFYVLFTVEDFKMGEYCTITWKRTPMPRRAGQNQVDGE
jgi:hypothetical protein